jgi:hypothetical protein
LSTPATETSYASWYIIACKASFNNECSFPRASKNRYTMPRSSEQNHAALALLHSENTLGVKPDYSQNVEELYTSIARDHVADNQSLDILVFCSFASRVFDVPSWVPDRSSPWSRVPVVSSCWSACGQISGSKSSVEDGLLRTTGIIYSHIETVLKINFTSSTRAEVLHILQMCNPTAI